MSAAAETVLFDYWRSSASYRLRIALNLAGIPYTAVPVDLVAAEQTSEAHLARNPQGLVPVLDIDGHRLTQSLAILDYLNDTRDMGLLPADPAKAVQVRALAHAIAVDLHPVCNLRVAKHAAGFTDDVPQGMADWMAHFIAPGLNAFETMLQGFGTATFCCGDAPTLADICLMPQLYNARRWNVDFSQFPRMSAVEATCAAHPAFAAAHPDTVNPD
ncbi:MAG: maleylacetoacetate isomerase [Shimia sp.]|jgi:maleylacetoacetate isomerase|uniref:maleylacetoacetate isomerase n=1 Tax=Shimia sp. TaxID=1954381 RepID=UPI004058B708